MSVFQEKDHNSEDEDEDKYADDIDMPGQNFDSKRRITVRNLRIREDIAKVSAADSTLEHSSCLNFICLYNQSFQGGVFSVFLFTFTLELYTHI